MTLAALLGLCIAVGGAIPLLTQAVRFEDLSASVSVAALALGVVFVLSTVRLARGDWFHPLAFPLTYVGFVLTLPIIYIALTRRTLVGVEPSDLTPLMLAIVLLTIAGIAGGSVLGLFSIPRPVASDQRPGIDHSRLLTIGRCAILIALIIRGYYVVTRRDLAYGEGLVAFTNLNSLDVLASFAFFVGVVLVATANASLRHKLGSKLDVALIGAMLAATLLSGSRGELVAPVLFLLWAQHVYLGRLSFVKLAVSTLALVVVFQGVAGYRAGDQFFDDRNSFIERSLGGVSTPLQVTNLLLDTVPEPVGFLGGETYFAALERQLPGPIAVRILGTPETTGTFAFHDIIGFDSPDAGLGFALPAEGYLNFGLPGVAGAALVVGLLVGGAYRRYSATPTCAMHVLYPILIATLPLSFRADAVAQIKTALYPMLFLWAVMALSQRRQGGSDAEHTLDPSVRASPALARTRTH